MAAADYQFKTDIMERQGDAARQQFDFDRLQDQTSRAMARSNSADAARAQAKSDLIGGIAGVANAAVGAFTGGMIGGGTKLGQFAQKFGNN